MAYKMTSWQTFTATTSTGRTVSIECCYQNTSYGFRHVAFYDNSQVAKATYYNRTWERFTYETVLRKALANLRESKDITKEEHNELYAILIDRNYAILIDKAEKDIQAFKALYDKTSDAFKERAKDLPLMQSESDVQAVKGLMLLDVLMNSGK